MDSERFLLLLPAFDALWDTEDGLLQAEKALFKILSRRGLPVITHTTKHKKQQQQHHHHQQNPPKTNNPCAFRF